MSHLLLEPSTLERWNFASRTSMFWLVSGELNCH